MKTNIKRIKKSKKMLTLHSQIEKIGLNYGKIYFSTKKKRIENYIECYHNKLDNV